MGPLETPFHCDPPLQAHLLLLQSCICSPSYTWVPVLTADWVGPITQRIPLSNLPLKNKRDISTTLTRTAAFIASLFVPAIDQAVLQAWTINQIASTMDAFNNLTFTVTQALQG